MKVTHVYTTPTTKLSSTHLSVPADEDGVALDVSVDDSLGVEVVQSPQTTLTDGSYLLLTQTGGREREREREREKGEGGGGRE